MTNEELDEIAKRTAPAVVRRLVDDPKATGEGRLTASGLPLPEGMREETDEEFRARLLAEVAR